MLRQELTIAAPMPKLCARRSSRFHPRRPHRRGPVLTTFEVYLYSTTLFLAPVIAYSIAKGSPPPAESTWLGKYYRAEKHLMLAGNLFVLSICLMAGGKLALHFGLVDPSMADAFGWITHGPFTFFFFVYAALWIRAALKLRRERASGA
jgi:hypothetical protein